MMAKAKTAYVCGECGAEYTKWQGQCTEGGVWNTLSEIVLESATPGGKASPATSRRIGWAGKAEAPK
ncbi:DNA repair protein RadA, partial [Acinetobacter baumannii]|nr:DNA repair protein RadA [Acinetobacter baumannii]